jgi:hypothetical protein
MDYKGLSRPLDISDVDFRVQSINNGGYATILAYKDARVDMNRLDEVVGPNKWRKEYSVINSQLFCGVSIYDDETSQWVTKWDVGTESFTEAEKGQASDAFKRACFNWGIGRELYDYPMISIKLNSDEWSKDSGRPKQTYNLRIREWRWHSEFTDGKLTFLAAKDQKGAVRYKFGALKSQEPKGDKESDANVKGLLKKKSDESVLDSVEKVGGIILTASDKDLKREALIEEYKAIFKKKPHGRMTNDSILKAISEATDKALNDVAENLSEVDITVRVPEISKFKNATNLVSWAREVVANDTVSNEDQIQEFRDKCNEQYALLTK